MKVSALALLCALSKTSAFSPTLPSVYVKLPPAAPSRPSIYSAPFHSTHLCSSAASVPSPSNESESSSASGEVSLTKQQKRLKQIREEGGIFAFNTKYGALNPFGIYYGLTSIALGLVWFVGLTASQLLYKVTGDKLDKKRRIPVFLSHVWGTLLMLFTACFPKIENGKIIKDFHKSRRTAMFVANHNSWMDIPFLGHTIGWKNYKFVAKKELEKVPILGKAIKVANNVLVDRSDRRSQLLTLKQGMKWLEDGVNLCTFPEGTRSRSNRLMPFKNGAFKMAHKAGAPVIPMSICRAADIMPSYWMFPFRPAYGICKVVVHEPIESKGKTEEELAQAVREAIISGLPDDQKPLS
ncbi:hypothetical protein ACHAXS_010858 [Conticribra weissflogii]